MITVPMDTMSVAVAAVVLIANVTTIRSIIGTLGTLGTELLVEVVVGVLVHLVQVQEEPL